MTKYVIYGRNVNDEWLELATYSLKFLAFLGCREYLYWGWQVKIVKTVREQ